MLILIQTLILFSLAKSSPLLLLTLLVYHLPMKGNELPLSISHLSALSDIYLFIVWTFANWICGSLLATNRWCCLAKIGFILRRDKAAIAVAVSAEANLVESFENFHDYYSHHYQLSPLPLLLSSLLFARTRLKLNSNASWFAQPLISIVSLVRETLSPSQPQKTAHLNRLTTCEARRIPAATSNRWIYN